MYQKIHLENMEDYFRSYAERTPQGVYFARLTVYNQEIEKEIQKYIELTLKHGVCIEGKIGNPEGIQLSYYEEVMGREYSLDQAFFSEGLRKWLPRISPDITEIIAKGFLEAFSVMAQKGKNENMQKNAYIKYMCWLYYKFEKVFLKNEKEDGVPKILYQGYPNEYELAFLNVLSKAGCDILLLLINGEEEYRKNDERLQFSDAIIVNGKGFPKDFSILEIRKEMGKRLSIPKLPVFRTEKMLQTNTWIQGKVYEDVECPLSQRGIDSQCFYNVFAGIYGVEDKSNYYSHLLQWKLKLEKDTAVYIIEELQKATYDEVNEIVRKPYESMTEMIYYMVKQIVCADKSAEAYAKASFVSVLEKETEMPVSKVTTYAVELVCVIKRYLSLMFGNTTLIQKEKKLLLYYGDIKRETERLFLEIMAGLPIDVVIINPEGKSERNIKSPLFFDKIYQTTMVREKFPTDIRNMQFQTVAYHAEQELNEILYQDTGIYRDRQFKKAVPIILSNTYEEISILWKEEAKYRPNFQILEDKVIVPVIFAKVSGVPDGRVTEYWESVAKLYTDEMFLIKEFPYLAERFNPWKESSYQFLEGTKLKKHKIMAHSNYPFAFIRASMQEYMLEKLQELLDSNVIEGTGINGTEYLIVATVFNMDREIIRQIQKYDFTKEIPKVMVIHTKESYASKEDAILLAYLSFVGFDIVVYVPTGYNGVEQYYTRPLMIEHQAGQYMYDLKIPNLKSVKRSSESIMGRLFRRGR